ncbi:MAG: bifunctional DNA primase/polymerase [Thermoproteota archaeon]|nr:bifunctional DNA primase/polymerase [Thermoproteota archaeon]
MGFKLLPLDENGKPAIDHWTPIYENPDYWTPEKLVQGSHRFKTVATVFGKTRLTDNGRSLYLYALDIDSEEVYKILFRLQNGNGPEYGLIDKMQQFTFVVKTRKPFGYHIYWLSHEQHKPIITTDCKLGNEFEIKGNKTCSTLPPSTHRDDPDFRYKNIGQNKLFVSDDLYGKLMEILAGCLYSKRPRQRENSAPREQIELVDAEIRAIFSAIYPYYKKGCRHHQGVKYDSSK